jgi:ferredoxin--NADP+ reductase
MSEASSVQRARKVAVVGAGPSGLYAAQAALRIDGVTVDVFDALPSPYGLVRYGVAPDHARTKAVTRAFDRILTDPGVRFLGNVTIGTDVTREELLGHYDAVVYATGARHDRSLDVPGVELEGSCGAAEFVSWYSGHPDELHRDLLSRARSAVVVGAGNVALDVTRILAKPAEDLVATDMPHAVIDVLRGSSVTELHLLCRRGPLDARFTPAELMELGELPNVDIVVDPADLAVEDASAGPNARANLDILREWAVRPSAGRPRRLTLHFWTTPTGIGGHDRVSAVSVHRRSPRGTEVAGVLSADLVVSAIGYEPRPLGGLPVDPLTSTVPNRAGRVIGPDGSPRPGEYVVGWIKRGPSGVIGTNRSDAVETIASVAEDLVTDAGGPARDMMDLLRDRDVRVVDWSGWQRVVTLEATLGGARGAVTVKTPDLAEMLRAASA